MVKQFASDFYHSKPSDLRVVVSSDFTFSSNLSEYLGFGYKLDIERYIEYSQHYYNFLKARDQFITSDDGIIFTVRFILEVLTPKKSSLIELKGLAIITTADQLIVDVQTSYFDDLSQYKRLRKMKIK